MRFLILNTDYPDFLTSLYASHPGLETQPYAEQARVRNETRFGVSDCYSTNLRRLGHEGWDIYVNNEFTQNAWAREHGVATRGRSLSNGLGRLLGRQRPAPWFTKVIAEQVAHYQPDVVLNLAMEGIAGAFLKSLKPKMRLLVGQHAAPLPAAEDIVSYDLVLSSLPNQVDYFRRLGVRAELKRLAFDPRILDRLRPSPSKIPVSFVGSLTSAHRSRLTLLEELCTRTDLQVWGSGLNGLEGDHPVSRRYRGKAWALEMYQILHDSRITLNHHIDIADRFANNMRLFEATGVGALLLTDWKSNLAEMFEPGREVVTYRTVEECTEKVHYYLDHEGERQSIARAGQQRTLREHSYNLRMQELIDVVKPYL